MKIIIGCEESQEICKSFRELGEEYEAYSCDTQDCSGGHPEWHIKKDILKVVKGGRFKTQSGNIININKWDMGIFHPPCTFITKAGTRWLFPKGKLDKERYKKGLKAKSFFMELLNVSIPKKCIENPVPHKIFKMPKPTQIIHPYYFGHNLKKATCLWLVGLPKLISTNTLKKEVVPEYYVDKKGIRHTKLNGWSQKRKSKTFKGIAKAMAEQWR